jgi:hypothetical protein
MAKAGGKGSTWLALRDACELMPFELLVRRLREGKERSRGLSKDGTVVEIPADFWGGLPVVDCNEGSAHSRFLSPDLRFYRIKVLCEEALRPAEQTAPLPTSQAPTVATAPTEIERPQGPQADRVLRVLPELYPPHGVVPRGTPIKTVEGKVAKKLADDSRRNGLADPRWDVVDRCVKYLRVIHA